MWIDYKFESARVKCGSENLRKKARALFAKIVNVFNGSAG
jgi:hypothetical protein